MACVTLAELGYWFDDGRAVGVNSLLTGHYF